MAAAGSSRLRGSRSGRTGFDAFYCIPGKDGALAFVGHPALTTGQLRQDLHRFVFLLGGNDGEPLFEPGHDR